MCKATKKKIVGGRRAKNSSLSLVDSLVMELKCDESCRFHGSCSFQFRFVVSVDPCRLSQKTRNAPGSHHSVKNHGRPQGNADRLRPNAGSAEDNHCTEIVQNHRADQSSHGTALRV